MWTYVCIYESNVNGSTTDAIDAKIIYWKKNRTPQKNKKEQNAETSLVPVGTKGFRPGAPTPRPRGGPLVPVLKVPGRKLPPPLSRPFSLASKTGTKGPLEPVPMGRFLLVQVSQSQSR